MKQIVPSAYLEYCPSCGSKLNLNNVIGGNPTACDNCDHVQPGGTAVFITFISSVLEAYATNEGIDTVYVGETPLTVKQALHGEGALPMLVQTAYQLRSEAGIDASIASESVGLGMVESDSALLGQRATPCVTNMDFSKTILELTNALDHWVGVTREQKLTKYKSEIMIPNAEQMSPMAAHLQVAKNQQREEREVINEPK